MTDRADATVLTLRYQDRRGERLCISPRDDGDHDVETRILTKGGDWRPTGHDIAERVSIEHGVDADPVRNHLTAALETVDNDDTDTRFHLRQALQLVGALEEGE